MSGACTVTPGYTFSTTGQGELITNPKLNLLAQPAVGVSPGSITDTEVSAISGTKITAGTTPIGALDAGAQAKFGFKNYCYNPGFWRWAIGTTFTSGTTNADGWVHSVPAISYTISRQTITNGENDTLLRQSRYFWRFVNTTTSATGSKFYSNFIRNPRLFSGQTVTISAVMRYSSGTLPATSFFIEQYFGSGGSPSSTVTTVAANPVSLSSSWALVSATIAVPSVSGKTFGSSSEGQIRWGWKTADTSTTFTLDVANVQVETGNAATTFEDLDAQRTAVAPYVMTSTASGDAALPKPTLVGAGLAIASSISDQFYWKPNVAQTVVTATATTTSGSFADISGLSTSLTTTYGNSKVLVRAVLNIGLGSGTTPTVGLRLARDGSAIGVGDAGTGQLQCSTFISNVTAAQTGCVVVDFLDTPGSINTFAYTVQWEVTGSGTAYLNRSYTDTNNGAFPRTISSLTCMEIPV